MKEVGFLSAFGMLATVIVVLIVLAMAIKDKPNHTDAHHDAVIWDQFPIALSSIVFSFGKFFSKNLCTPILFCLENYDSH